ncbi:hypothetical protein [Pararhizobium haloflavum]|uniref:hypothetical protein n=1 Tax=Pararhizobium haloflavum TaxID=2037914 RepID=UPI000C181BB1|nr:hypothetical protein [Pararhizobium haloflavum]
MHWSIVTVAAIGMLMGLRFRAPALLAVTFLTIAAGFFFFDQNRVWSTVWLVLILQSAYLTSLCLLMLWRRRSS